MASKFVLAVAVMVLVSLAVSHSVKTESKGSPRERPAAKSAAARILAQLKDRKVVSDMKESEKQAVAAARIPAHGLKDENSEYTDNIAT